MAIVRVKRIAYKIAFILLLFMWSGTVHAQYPNRMGGGGNRDQLGIGNMMDQQNQAPGEIPGVVDHNAPPEDTTAQKKPPKIRKPLESYFFDDSLRARPNFVWNASLEKNIVREVHIDTMMNDFQADYPYLHKSVGAAYLGNLGAASMPLDYFSRADYRDFHFAQAFDAYLMSPEEARFFNVKNPFSHLSYFWAGQQRKLEESFWGTHAQNISPSTGFNADYRSRGTKGYYSHQKAREKNLSLGFSHTGKRYTAHAGYIYNMGEINENGGIVNDRDITDTVFEIPELVTTALPDAKNLFKNNIFYAIQSYGIPLRKLSDEDFSIADRSSIFIGHSIKYSRFWKKYSDTFQQETKGTEGESDYREYGSGYVYDNWYIDPSRTNDSIFESVLSNRIFLQIQPWDRNGVIGVIDAGVGNDIMKYYQFRPDNYLGGGGKEQKSSSFVYGSVEGHLRRYATWGGNIKYHPFGYRGQDFSIGGNIALKAFIKDNPITLNGSVSSENRTPSYWTENFFSNHFVWQNSFSKESETRFDVSLDIPHINVELGAHQSIVTDKVYYGADKLPAQYSGAANVSGLYARKDFHFGGFRLNNRVLLQWSTVEEVVPVPKASVYLSYLYEFNVVRDVLRLQIGIDGRYNTKYYAPGYNPATAQFYNQREKQLGGYPMLDVFVNAKWKRMRILVKLQHANEDLFGERNYFNVLHYPLNKRVFKIGFSWTFYD